MDENRITFHDILIFFLNTLLIMGAIAVLLSVDGGRWLTSNPAFYDSSSQNAANESAPAPAGIPSTGAQPAPADAAQCIPTPASLLALGVDAQAVDAGQISPSRACQ